MMIKKQISLSIIVLSILCFSSLGIQGTNGNVISQEPIGPDNSIDNTFLLKESTFVGGSTDGTDYGYDIAVDSNGNTIIAGYTSSTNFTTKNAYDDSHNGGYDFIITKLSPSMELLWSTYIGGSDTDFLPQVAIDQNDNIILTGITLSTDFPTKNAEYPTHNSEYDIVLFKFLSDGILDWSTYLGGSDYERVYGLSVDNNGEIWIAGHTTSNDFPNENEFDNTYDGSNDDGFVSKFSTNGRLLFSSYWGGSLNDYAYDITTDSDNNAIVVGFSTSSDFSTKDAYSSSLGGPSDTVITKLSPSGAITWSTYFGGSYVDDGHGVTTDEFNNIYVVSQTRSDDFPTKNGYINGLHPPYDNAAISKFYPSGSLSWSTYFGGGQAEGKLSISSDQSGNVVVTGTSSSSNLPMKNAYNSTRDLSVSSFIAYFTSYGDLQFSTYLGGSGADYIYASAIDSDGVVRITGRTNEQDFPLKNAYDETFDGGSDIFYSSFFLPFDDYDDDKINNLEEGKLGLDIENPDTDGDTMTDGFELLHGLLPLDASDRDLDYDNDTMTNAWEFEMGFDPTDPHDAAGDNDNDNLTNAKEFGIGTDPHIPDTDGDLLLDGEEVLLYQTDPLNADTDGDGIDDGQEILIDHSNPLDSEETDDSDDDDDGDNSEGGSIDEFLPISIYSSIFAIMLTTVIVKTKFRYNRD